MERGIEMTDETRTPSPQGDAGDAIDFAVGHCAPDEAVAFLDDWRSDRTDEWPGYVKWLATQRRGAAEAKARTPSPSDGIDARGLLDGGQLLTRKELRGIADRALAYDWRTNLHGNEVRMAVGDLIRARASIERLQEAVVDLWHDKRNRPAPACRMPWHGRQTICGMGKSPSHQGSDEMPELIDARGLVIAELKAATDEMSFDLCGNDFAYVANRLMPIFARELEAQSATIERMREEVVWLEAEARRIANFYPEASDGRNTFVIFADKIAALAQGQSR